MIIIIMSGGFLLLLCFYCSLMPFAECFFLGCHVEAGDHKENTGEPDASLLWNHVCFSGKELLSAYFLFVIVYCTISPRCCWSSFDYDFPAQQWHGVASWNYWAVSQSRKEAIMACSQCNQYMRGLTCWVKGAYLPSMICFRECCIGLPLNPWLESMPQALLNLRPQTLGSEVLNSIQTIFLVLI